jgi:hypothetical protein
MITREKKGNYLINWENKIFIAMHSEFYYKDGMLCMSPLNEVKRWNKTKGIVNSHFYKKLTGEYLLLTGKCNSRYIKTTKFSIYKLKEFHLYTNEKKMIADADKKTGINGQSFYTLVMLMVMNKYMPDLPYIAMNYIESQTKDK